MSAESQIAGFKTAPTPDASDLIDLIYKAAVDPNEWRGFVAALSSSCGGAAVAISLQIPVEGIPIHGARIGLLDEYAPLFTKHQRLGLPWGSLTMPLYTDQFAFGSDVLANERVAETVYYKEYMQPQGLAPEGPLSHIFATHFERATAALVIYRRVEGRVLDWRDLERCNQLVPHLARAYRIHTEMHGEFERRRALSEVVDRFPMGVVLLDRRRRCVVVNSSAERILGQNQGIALEDGRVVALDPQENEKLQQAITAAAASTGIPGPVHLTTITRPSGKQPFGVMVNSLMEVPTAADAHDAVSVLFISYPEAGQTRTEVLEELYELTPAEARLVCQLVVAPLDEAARVCGIRTSTARGYLKSAYSKTGTRSQRDLIRLILTGVGPISGPT